MDVLTSLMTRGCLVRTPKGQHGMVDEFDKRTNTVHVQLGPSGPFADFHFVQLRAGDDASEEHVCGAVTRGMFPKDPWPNVRERNEARTLPHPRTEALIGYDQRRRGK